MWPRHRLRVRLNVTIAKNLGVPVVLVTSGEGKTTAQMVSGTLTALRGFEAREVQVLAIVANKVRPEQALDVQQLLRAQLPSEIILSVIPKTKPC
ncbi:AAA family ATPase [Hymenobacter oligotrophus]|uniref:AAA family ATPase n=1 Tax=Hymenobacter oligotrophus TaxID=2319843 RepID=UPI001F09EBEB|nr:AAA family ATPase [Hymenobacter oligotrophus]